MFRHLIAYGFSQFNFSIAYMHFLPENGGRVDSEVPQKFFLLLVARFVCLHSEDALCLCFPTSVRIGLKEVPDVLLKELAT